MTKQSVFFLVGGISALIIAMGIGRFAYTPILPLMQNDELFSNAVAGYLASSNYAGYLVGALLTGIMPWRQRRTNFFRLSLIISILTTACMGFSNSFALWFIMRFLSGVASSFVFVLSSSIVLDKLAAGGKSKWSGYFYGGVGLGIFLTGLMVPILNRFFAWEGAWIGLAVISVIPAVFAWIWLIDEPSNVRQTKNPEKLSHLPPSSWLAWLIVAYGCEGLGYIVTGTFIVSIAEKIPGFNGDASLVWMVVGVAAVPSCMIWSILAAKWGFVNSLVIAMILQSVGIVAPVFWSSLSGVIISALLFGVTFMGITTLATTLAREMSVSGSTRIIGYLTAIYAFGQMLGPTAAGVLSSTTQNFNGALAGASGVVFLGSCMLMTGLRFRKTVQTRSIVEKIQ